MVCTAWINFVLGQPGKKYWLKEGVSINQFISSAVSEKVSALMTEDYLINRTKRAKKKDFRKILTKVPNRKPIHGDEL